MKVISSCFLFLISSIGLFAVNRINNLVKVYRPSLVSLEQLWGQSWPEGIRLLNNFHTSINDPGYSRKSVGWEQSRRKKNLPPRRTYTWDSDHLIISFNMTALANPLCTRLVPPLSWITKSGAPVKIYNNGVLSSEFHQNQPVSLTSDSSASKSMSSATAEVLKNFEGRFVEITVPRERIENTMVALRQHGFSREDIYRILDKGPWVLAFCVSKSINKIFVDLKTDLKLDNSEVVRVLSHCPFLLAQEARYRGRDVYATVCTLLDVGVTEQQLVEDCLRFPSLLTAPPDRIHGWRSLLEGFGVATEKRLFGKLLRKAPFMMYVNPPSLFDQEETQPYNDNVSVTASGFIVYEALRILQLLQEQGFSSRCIDRIVRSSPSLLLSDSSVLRQRLVMLRYLMQGYSRDKSVAEGKTVTDESPPSPPQSLAEEILKGVGQPSSSSISPTTGLNDPSIRTGIRASETCAQREGDSMNDAYTTGLLETMLYSYPTIINVDASHMRSVSNALRASGLRRLDATTLVKRYPGILHKDPVVLRSILEFLKTHCGLRKGDLLPLLLRCPKILSKSYASLLPLVDYLYEGLGGTPLMLRRTPAYLSLSLDEYIRPRAEFLRAFHIDPLCNGLSFLINASPDDLATLANVQTDVFYKFRTVYSNRWRTKQSNNYS